MRKLIFGTLALLALSACQNHAFAWDQTPVSVQRFYADQFQDQPFDVGAISVLTEEHGELHTYLLRPCRSNTRVCGTQTGSLQRTADFAIVSGAYPRRTFYLSPGGDGYVTIGGSQIPLAWNE